jgi:hypothetical protein
MGTSTIAFPRKTSRHACHQFNPWSIMPPAIV